MAVTSIKVTGNVTEALAALDRLGIRAEEVGKLTEDKLGGGARRAGNAFSRLGAMGESWGIPFASSLTKIGDKIGEAETKGKKFGTALAGVGKAVALGVTAGAAVVGFEGVKMATDFQQHIELLHTAGGESTKGLATVAAGIKKIATQTGTSLDQLTEGMYTVEKAGDRGADGLKVLKAAAEGAKAENVDLGTATNALTSIMMSYHLKADQATAAENMLVAGAGAAKTTMESYAGALSTVLPVASAAGISFSQVGGAIATLTQHGTSADEATQELANTIRGLQAPSQVAQKAMQQIGLNVNDVSKNLGKRGLTGTIDLITEAIGKKLGPSGMVVVDTWKKSASASADLQTMLTKMPAPLQKLSDEFMHGQMSYSAYYKAIKGFGGTAYTTGAQFLSLYKSSKGFNDLLKSGQPEAQTYAAQLKAIMGGATGMNTALMLSGENSHYFANATKEVAKAGAKSGKDISTWADTQKNLSVQLAQAKETLDVLMVDIGSKLIPVVSKTLKVIEAMVGWFDKHRAAAIALGIVVGGVLVGAFTAWAISLFMADGALAFLIGPIGLVIAAVAALAAGVYELVTHWSAVWRDIKQWTLDAWNDGIKPVFQWIKKIAIEPLKVELKLYEMVWKATFDGIKAAVSGAWNDVIKPVFGFIKTVAIDEVKFEIQALETIWSDTWNLIKGALSGAWNDVLKPVFGFIKTLGIDVLHGAIQGFETIWSGTWSAVTTAVQDAWAMIKPVLDTMKSAVQDTLGVVGKVGSAVSGAISGKHGITHGFGLWADGGWVNAPAGSPVPGVVHGQEYVLSNAMLAGVQPIDPNVLAAVIGNAQPSGGVSGSTVGGGSAPAAGMAAPPAGAGLNVNVSALTNASAVSIAQEIVLGLRQVGLVA